LAANPVNKAKNRRQTAAVKVTAAPKKAPATAAKTKTAVAKAVVKKPLVRTEGDTAVRETALTRENFLVAPAKTAAKGPKVKAPREPIAPADMDMSPKDDDVDVVEAVVGQESAQWLAGSEAALNEEKRRKAVVPPENAATGMNLFEYLNTCTPPLDQKIVDIAIAQTQVPLELRGDAAQEIRLVWSTMKPDLSRFKPGQIASYAHRMAKHTALRLRRELGSSVRLPGSAFRKRRDGSSYVTPGVLSVALDWSELEGWLDMDNASSEDSVVPGLGLGVGEEEVLAELGGMVESYSGEDNEEAMLKQRHQILESFKDKLTERQFQILMRLSRGDTYEEIQAALTIKKGVLMRELNLAACVIGPL
jgi:DNA-directed RNA polymerase specialized sigma24 family protein